MTANVQTLQENLTAKGFAPGPIDGIMGPQTLRACCYVVSGAFIELGQAADLWAAMKGRGITSPLRIAHFLANCGAESRFELVAENLNYSATRLMDVWPNRFPTLASAAAYAGAPQKLAGLVYGGRMGNIQDGDGYKFRGRGYCQLTGRGAYEAIGFMTNLPLVDNPDIAVTSAGASLVAAAFWNWKALGILADRDDGPSIRQRWNGGMNGYPTVQAATSRLKQAWGLAG